MKRFIAVVGVLLLACGVLWSAVAGSQSVPLAVTGFQEEFDPPSAIDASAAALSTVGIDGVNLNAAGTAVGAPDAQALAQRVRAHHDHLAAVLLIGNWDNAINDFDEPTAYGLLRSSHNIAVVAGQLAGYVHHDGFSGVSVDLESLLARDRGGLVSFVRALRTDLGGGDPVSVDVTNYTDVGDYNGDGYNLAALGHAANRITLMAYDQHGPWENQPGPVGALSWVQAGLAVVLRYVAASKIDLGIAGYGYSWGPHGNQQFGDAQARAMVAANGATATYDAAVGEWTATLRDATVMWWSDARTYAQRYALAQSDGLHGVAVWSLGESDPIAVR